MRDLRGYVAMYRYVPKIDTVFSLAVLGCSLGPNRVNQVFSSSSTPAPVLEIGVW